jgi:crotonobetainyl-CoA:carnitine CoA-transferase CaiB-like acyl-CoA transferase
VPFATYLLASHFFWVDRRKESLKPAVKPLRAAELLLRLIVEQADDMVQNLGPDAVARPGPVSSGRL